MPVQYFLPNTFESLFSTFTKFRENEDRLLTTFKLIYIAF